MVNNESSNSADRQNPVPFDHSIAWDFLSLHHGLWYDFIEVSIDGQGKIKRSLKGYPVLSDGFRRLYKANPGDELGLFKIVPRKSDQRKVVDAIRRVLNGESVAASDTIEVRALDGSRKIVEVYVRELQTSDGRPIIVSMHSDLTVSHKYRWIFPTIADRIGALIFVKRWDKNAKKFRFVFCNDDFAKALGAEPEQVIDNSDANFFDDDHLVDSFYRDDLYVLNELSGDKTLVREESFRIRSMSVDINDTTRRLLTFKTRLEQSDDTQDAQVLGISIDISEVTDVLRAVSEVSEKAIYVKDNQGRYVVANRRFAELLGKNSDHEILHRTLAEILKESQLGPSEYKKSILVANVAAEDQRVMTHGETSVIRTADLYDQSEWVTEKKRFLAGQQRIPYIVGNASPLFPTRLWHVLESMPQCVSVKVFDESKIGTAEEFHYVWANRSYLDRHKLGDLTDLVGMTDQSIGQRDCAPPDQWKRFVMKDREVLDACKKFHRKRKESLAYDWNEFVSFLVDSNCWEFRETQELRGKQRSLQTTKWAENILNRWYIIIVYSDVTLGDVELRRYHRRTVHAMREIVSPIEPAIRWLNNAVGGDSDEVARSLKLLRHVREDAEWFLRHHLDLFDLNVDNKSTTLEQVADMCKDLMKKRQLCSDERIQYKFEGDTKIEPRSKEWHVDVRFLRVVIAEILLNAMKWVVSKLNAVANIANREVEIADYKKTGWHNINISYLPLVSIEMKSTDDEVYINISDNGSATSNHQHRQKLIDSLGSNSNVDRGIEERLGIQFCKVAIERTGGTLSIDPDPTFTTIKLRWRLR